VTVGVDRLSLSMPLRDWEADPSVWDQRTVRNEGRKSAGRPDSWSQSLTVQADGASVFLGVAMVEGRPWGKIETNPSRFGDPDGCSLLPVAGLPGAVGRMWEVAGGVMRPNCELGQARVRRLDVARDFRLEHVRPALLVSSLARVRRPYARWSGVWSSPSAGDAQTLHAGSGAGMVRLYDQHEAYAERGAPEGSLRWEAEARRGWLGRLGGGIEDVDVLVHAGQRVERLALDRWGWSGMGATVAARAAVASRALDLVESGEMSAAVVRGCLGEWVLRSEGLASMTSPTTAARYRRFCEVAGLPADGDGDWLQGGSSVRLDFELGREVWADAA
jgi:hypothetical protein